MHAHYVLSHDSYNKLPQIRTMARNIRQHWLGRRADCVFHSLYPIQGLLGHATTEPAVHDTGTLRHDSGRVQSEQRRLHAVHPYPNRPVAQSTPQAEDGLIHRLQHGSLRRK